MTGNEDMDTLLAAYADGELDPPTAMRVEAWLQDNPDGQKLLAIHRDTTMLLRAAFSEQFYARGTGHLPPPVWTASRLRAALPRFGWAVAASLLMGMIGYGTGAHWPGLLISGRDRMLTEVAEYHSVYSRETVHLVEVPASQADHLKLWLGKRVNRALIIPDFKEAGLTFAGGRMVVLDGAPVAELMYTREKGLPIGFCVLYHRGTPAPLRLDNRGAVNMATWDDGSHSYIVVGEAEQTTLRTLASLAQKQL